MRPEELHISDFNYPLPEERIAKYPLPDRDGSRLLVYRGGEISQTRFNRLDSVLPADSLLVFNNTRVIRARIIMHKPQGARIELFCLEPHLPADYERAFAVRGRCEWLCIIGNLKKWKQGTLEIPFDYDGRQCRLSACRLEPSGMSHVVRFEWDADMTFGQLLEHLGRIPIPPYLNRASEEIDNSRYQTVYSKIEGSVAAPTAGLHFTDTLMERMRRDGYRFEEVTLHVGAGTFLPVKEDDVSQHAMHTEHFEINLSTVENLLACCGSVTAVGTTSVRTLESLAALGYRALRDGKVDAQRTVGQWEIYDIPDSIDGRQLLTALRDSMLASGLDRLGASTRIMIEPGYRFRVVNRIITNFHQPKSTLLLLVSAFVGDDWRRIYDYALHNDFRFLSYGDSSLLLPDR